MRFYMGTIWISGRADLAPVYAMIFRRLKALGSDWIYHLPKVGLVEFEPPEDLPEGPLPGHSVSDGAIAELKAQQHRAEVQRFRAHLEEADARAREAAMDRSPPATVRTDKCTDVIHVAGHRS